MSKTIKNPLNVMAAMLCTLAGIVSLASGTFGWAAANITLAVINTVIAYNANKEKDSE